MAVSLHPLRLDELEMLGRWLSEPLVARWWNHQTSRAALERDFGPAVAGRASTRVLIAEWEGQPFGLIQSYPVSDHPGYLAELAALCEVPAGAVSIDYLIGSQEFRGQGLGTRMIASGVTRAWTEHPGACDVIVPVHVHNRASWRSLERAGFDRIARGRLTPDNPGDSPDHYVYRFRRPAP
jgi:aminoglycoside 6'-N-acetyltransferase